MTAGQLPIAFLRVLLLLNPGVTIMRDSVLQLPGYGDIVGFPEINPAEAGNRPQARLVSEDANIVP